MGRLVFKTSEGRASVPGGFDSRPLPPRAGDLEVVLVGGGHAHVEVLRRFAMDPPAGLRPVVVARDALTPYSGMLPGYLAGRYGRDRAHIDLRPLALRAGARLICAAATGLDLERRRVLFAHRPPLAFDLVSLDIGSRPPVAAIAGADRHALAVKPVDAFLAGWHRVEAAAGAAAGTFRIAVIGGGAGGVELCLGLQRRLGRALAACGRPAAAFALVTEGGRLLENHGARASRLLAAALARAGIALHTGRRVASIGPAGLVLDDGAAIACDAAVLATGAAAPAWLADTGLALDGAGFVRVDACLRSLSHPFVLAAGDIAAFDPRPLQKNGVQAVRQGPLLARNLRRLARGLPPAAFRPRRRSLALIASGGGRAVASWGRFACEGAWVWRWKDSIDRRWMRRYRRLPAMAPAGGGEAAMRCGGCGAKVPAHVLRRALGRLQASRPETLALLAAPDDAAEIAPPPGSVAVQTVDQFPALIGDAYLFGRIAACHALSDIHAMGAKPAFALVLAGLLPGSARAMEEELVQMLQGVVSILEREGCALAGGHSGEATLRASLGLAVTGFAPPSSLVRMGGLEAGDALVLTRPLGTGVLFAAEMAGEARSPWIEAALAGMQESNAPAADILKAHGVHAMTDVTGFGLAGHLRAMLVASGVAARLDGAALPAWPGARELLARGIASTLHPGNVAALADIVDAAADPLLFDPQTAGGLLAGLPASRAAACVRALRAAGCARAAIVGEIVPGPPAIRLSGGDQSQ